MSEGTNNQDKSIMDLLDELHRWVKDGTLETASKQRKFGDELQKVLNILDDGADELSRIDNIRTSADLAMDSNRELIAREAKRLQITGEKLLKADSHETLQSWRQHYWRNVKDAGEDIERELRRIWWSKCEKAFSEQGRLGEVLQHFEQTKDLGHRMSDTSKNGKALGNLFPTNKETRDAFEIGVLLCKEQRDELAETGGTEGVAKLLLEVVGGEATLAELTDETFDWLKHQNALKVIRLKLD